MANDIEEIYLSAQPLPCPPRINNDEGLNTLRRVRVTFEVCSPPTLHVVSVKPEVSQGGIFKCRWIVNYENRDKSQALTDIELEGELERYAPRGCRIIIKSKEMIPPGWCVLYWTVGCRCGSALQYEEISEDSLSYIFDTKISIEEEMGSD